MASQQGQRQGKLSGRTIGTAVLLLPAAAILMPSIILFGIGMLPTVVAYVIDRTGEKYQTITVGLLNVCGILPGLVRLWSDGQTYTSAIRIASDPFSLVIAYGAAAAGWSIYLALPLILAHYYAATTESRLRTLRRRQATLVEAWGDEIAGEPPADAG